MTLLYIPRQRDIDHLTVALWRARVWLNERSRAVYKLPVVPRMIQLREKP